MMIIIVNIIEKQVCCVVCNNEIGVSPQVDRDNNDYCQYYPVLSLCSFIMIFLLFFF